ncbi:MAG: hypothetical protein CL959_04755 [Euryarchaeota archaeon]|jgi:hypothetical protein|nr:hypothetical protein [Euryarchaeota archaeon]|tara:strand:+ start:112 stop:429 length:318 start_codon:yes stop_codon:yes gene_type:complete
MQREGNLVPVDAPENKQGHHSGQIADDHKMVMHQLNNLHQNACELLEHLSHCATPHLEEDWVKKKIILATDYLDSVRDYVMSGHGGKMEADKGDGFLVMVEKHMS